MPPESLGSTRWTLHLLFSPLQYLRWLQGTSPLSLCDGDTAREKAAACSQGTQEVALRGFWALVTTALPTLIHTHTFQEPES